MIAELAPRPAPAWFPPDAELERALAARQPVYRWRRPRYLLRQLKDLAALMPEGPCRVIDVGAGSGLVGETIARFFPGKHVTAIDVVDRFLPGLGVAHSTFDGRRIPHGDGAFDCAIFSNVLHHVPLAARAPLLAETVRVTGGRCIVIKDHLAASALDHARLAALDFIGNLPFGGMVWARYLTDAQWRALFDAARCDAERVVGPRYRSGAMGAAFPNRLEVLFRLRSAMLRAP
ncbi:MAG TPA: class I SAM-dependent methyltransferase [Burkholderiales bacterium]|jgi:SAM-dependent methyltransferase